MGESNKKNWVYIISVILMVAMAAWGILGNESFAAAASASFSFLTTNFGWLYLITMVACLVFGVYLACSKYGNVRLGKDTDRPEYSNLTWFGLLFGAGMGVGLVFWGVAEPTGYFVNGALGAAPGTEEAAQMALRTSFMHWGILPWVNYAVIGLPLAYYMFRKDKPGMVSYMIEPLVGEKKARGILGKIVDILAVFATVAGVLTSLGLGVVQLNAGFNKLFGVPVNLTVQAVIIVVISIIYIGCTVSGLDKGIKFISDTNLYVAIGLMVVLFLVGPTLDILNGMTTGTGQYIQNFISDAFLINIFGDNSWFGSWRLFYWAWFIAWAPFVGIFIARVSKGRTIREFIIGVAILPTVASIIWISIFGVSGMNLVDNGTLSMEAVKAASSQDLLFDVLMKYPLGTILAFVAMISLLAFFITSANSGVFTLSMLCSNGSASPSKSKMIIWGIIIGILAIALLMVGGLSPLQTVSLVAAFPFIFIMFAVMLSFIKAIKKEKV